MDGVELGAVGWSWVGLNWLGRGGYESLSNVRPVARPTSTSSATPGVRSRSLEFPSGMHFPSQRGHFSLLTIGISGSHGLPESSILTTGFPKRLTTPSAEAT